MTVENIITYPADKRDRMHQDFTQIIASSGWQQDIQFATDSLEQSAADAEEMRAKEKKQNVGRRS